MCLGVELLFPVIKGGILEHVRLKGMTIFQNKTRGLKNTEQSFEKKNDFFFHSKSNSNQTIEFYSAMISPKF